MPRGRQEMMESLKEPKPKNIREVPDYLKRLVTKFTKRLIYILSLVWESQPIVLFVMIFLAVFNGVTPVIGSFIRARLLNCLSLAYTGNVTYQACISLLVLQFVYNLVVRLIGNAGSLIERIAGERVMNHIKVKIMNKSRELDLACFDLPEFYSKLENANREAGTRPMQIINSTLRIMSTIITMVSYVVVLGAISPFAPLIVVIISIPSAFVSFVYREKNYNYIKQRSKDRRQMGYYSGLVVNKDMVKEIRIFGLFDLFIGRYKEIFERYFKGQKKLIIGENIWHMSLSVLSTVVNCMLFIYIAAMVFSGEILVGDFSLYTGALGAVAGGVGTIISTTAQIYEGTLFIDNMIEFMEQKQTVIPLLAEPKHVNRGEGHTIVFDHVSFRYPGTDHNVLNDINLTFEPGDTAVLVGLNGAGKTTLIKLLTRLYDPTEGTIYLDGEDIRDYDTEELYSMFGIIFQDFGRYAVTVRENIRFGQLSREDEDADDTLVSEAAERSAADQFIDVFPEKYGQPLMRHFEENGIELSGGQWQKLAIARAFYSGSDIVILDEPTASLDPMAEQEIFNQFEALSHNKTTIFVSHRLSSATLANKIIVLEQGEVIEEGNHHELMKKHGRYYELFSTQAKRYADRDYFDGDGYEDKSGNEDWSGSENTVIKTQNK